ncbi:MAG: hypothetical protein LBC19_10880 [Tannerella sp.]|nr:hypothetical protein [Tannerella sp.]
MLNDIIILFYKIGMIVGPILGLIIGIYLGNVINREAGDSIPDEIKRCLRSSDPERKKTDRPQKEELG